MREDEEHGHGEVQEEKIENKRDKVRCILPEAIGRIAIKKTRLDSRLVVFQLPVVSCVVRSAAVSC